jgi:ribose transport system ATP-binding protein
LVELLRTNSISKEFPGVKALSDIDIIIHSGEVLGLLGENGAGKSTLLNILSGIYQPDGGEVLVDGKRVVIQDVQHAFELGIAIVHQELKLHGNMSVAENIFMGRLPVNKFKKVQYKKLFRDTEELFLRYRFNVKFDIRQEVRRLPIAEQQMVEIMKALSYNAKVILMDEPTSSLTTEETERLFTIIRNLKEQGVGIVFISHKLEEIKELCDRVVVLRDGYKAGERNVGETTEGELVSMMVGREISDFYPEKNNTTSEVVLEVRNLNREDKVVDVNFDVRKGEVFGIAGLVGAGRSELVRLIYGADKKDSGEILINGKKTEIRNPIDAINNGIFLVPEDRKKQGLVLIQDIEKNVVLPVIRRIKKLLAYIDLKEEKRMTDEQIETLKIKATGRNQIVNTLSGGNQQKVVLGKCLLTNPQIMILDDPTRGIDVGTKAEIYELINKITESGKSVILISSELPEIVKMSDRVAVMNNGRITKILEKEELTQERIITYAIGG